MSRRPDYWRSLAQLGDAPEAREFLEREFPRGASELPEGISRRSMLTLIGASLSMAGLAGCRRPVEKIVPYVMAPEESLPGVPQRYATTMPLGHGAYGLVVESHEGRPTKVEGNTLHPSTLGASNVWMQASILDLYDPDRSSSVLRDGVAATWDDLVAAWGELAAAHEGDAGAGLAVLTESFSSPTRARLVAALGQRYPQARVVAWDPVSDENILAGVRKATGRALQPMLHLDRAACVLALDADFLATETDNVRHAREFAAARRVTGPGDEMSRLYAVEGTLSLTGANADHRKILPSGEVAAFVGRLAAALGLPGATANPLEGDTAWLRAVAADLFAHRGRGLVVAGRRQPPAVHAAVLAINQTLGNVGDTVTYHALDDAAVADTGALAGLVQAMGRGEIRTLVMLGGNPAYNAPADLDFAAAMRQVPLTVHLSSHVDETSRASSWHVPLAHFLESWSDARAVGGTASVIQPLIAPLLGGKSDVEMLGLLATGEDAPGHDHVRETWKGLLKTNDDLAWRRVLHDGLLAASASAAVTPGVADNGLADLDTSGPGGAALEIVYEVSPSVYDGRWANNGWLQELPESMSKLTWSNAALLSPATAEARGLANGDVVEIRSRDRTLELPVWIEPGRADGTVGVRLGYGRQAAGRVGNGRGGNAYLLRESRARDFHRGVELTATGASRPLAETQDHGTMDALGEDETQRRIPVIVREATLEEFRQEPGFAAEMVKTPPLESLWQEQAYDEGLQWGMTIDLNACTGCNACVVACQSENNIPVVGPEQVMRGREMHWLRIDRYFKGDPSDPQTVFQPVPCMQCENAPCEQVCPVAATVHDAEGLNTMVYNRCIGTRYCSNNCPYKVRRFNFFNFTKDTPKLQQMAYNPDVTVRSRGVMEKCTYCTQRISRAKLEAKLGGRAYEDGDVQTACEQSCPSRAITFGDIRDPESRVSRSKGQDRNYVLLAELNNKPRTSYLAKLRNPNPDLTES